MKLIWLEMFCKITYVIHFFLTKYEAVFDPLSVNFITRLISILSVSVIQYNAFVPIFCKYDWYYFSKRRTYWSSMWLDITMFVIVSKPMYWNDIIGRDSQTNASIELLLGKGKIQLNMVKWPAQLKSYAVCTHFNL
jgi:hypothetical protein